MRAFGARAQRHVPDCREAAGKALEEKIETADLTEIVTDAAVLFLLGIKRHGVKTPEDIPACSVSYDVAAGKKSWHYQLRGRRLP